jgi:hypothetical protein
MQHALLYVTMEVCWLLIVIVNLMKVEIGKFVLFIFLALLTFLVGMLV